jgi:hypothetical protein
MFNYDEWVNNHEHIYNMNGAVWKDQKAFGRIAVEAALKNAESATTGLQQLKQAIALVRRASGLYLSINAFNICKDCLDLIEQRACV